MEKRFDKLEEKLDTVIDHIGHINVTLARNTKDLEHHIRRTEINEETLDLLKQEISPLKTAHAEAQGASKAVKAMWGVVGVLIGLALNAAKLFFGD